MGATIGDVARLAGLSRATVSRVLNHHPYVSDEKRALVYQAMKTLDYRPNRSAQKLRNRKTDTIAVLVPRLTNPFFAYLTECIELEAKKHDLQLVICHTQYDKTRESKFLEKLHTKHLDGIILTSIENDWDELYPLLRDAPAVICNEYPGACHLPTVKLDQVMGGYMGTKHLVSNGHRKIGFCHGGYVSAIVRDRERGFRQALEEADLPFEQEWRFSGVFDVEGGRNVIRRWLSMSNRPTAFFTGSDEVASGMISEAKRRGIRIPDDLAVVGFDDQPIASIVEPNVTTLRQPVEAMAREVMNLMICCLNGNRDATIGTVIELPLELIERGSTLKNLTLEN